MKYSGLLPLLSLALLYGCGSSETARKDPPPPTDDFREYIAANESTFHPEDFGVETWENEHAVGDGGTRDDRGDPLASVQPDTIPGFRVQVSITQEIETAAELRDTLSALLSGEWVYVVYHPPYYKIRIGNFPDRSDALTMLDRIRRNGYPDAWIVPDKILRDPPRVREESRR